jgi:hypothetical protein
MEKTFQGEIDLPSLPVPDLIETCHKYRNSGKDINNLEVNHNE